MYIAIVHKDLIDFDSLICRSLVHSESLLTDVENHNGDDK